MSSWRRWVIGALVATLPAGLSAVVSSPATGETVVDGGHVVAPGVEYLELRRSPSLVAHVARIAPDAGVDVRPVLAHDAVGDPDPARAREATSAMCTRAHGILCINADFATCPTCRSPFGGVVVDGRVLRTPNPAHEQLTVTGEGLTTAPLRWGGHLVAEYVWRAELESPLLGGDGGQRRIELRRERRELPLAGLNVEPVPGGTVLYTPRWGQTTGGPPAQLEVLVATSGPVVPGAVRVDIGPQRFGAGAIPAGGAVLSGDGAAAEALGRFVDEWRHTDATEKSLVIETALSLPARHSVGGHPVLLRGGQRQAWSPDDPKARGRHPRTLLGWTPDGSILLVVADGRRPGHSAGLTLDEAADLLRELGADDGINLDGGGSSTFVGPCRNGPCVLNRPSDGRERLVPLALAVVGGPGPLSALPAREPPPLPPPGPPPADDPASTAHVAPAQPEPTPAPGPEPEAATEPVTNEAPADASARPRRRIRDDVLSALRSPGPHAGEPRGGGGGPDDVAGALAAVLVAGVGAAAVVLRRRARAGRRSSETTGT